MTHRRGFLRDAALLGAAFAVPGQERGMAAREGGWPGSARAQDPWAEVRARFTISPRGIYFNTGTVGASPRAVVEATEGHLEAFETVFEQRAADIAGLRAALGELLDAPADSFAFPRNTTEAMSWVAGGLDLARGGEILMTDQEHVGGQMPWEAAARRHGLTVRYVRLPVPARSAQQVHDAWMREVTPRTRVAMITHVTFSNGLIQPVRELCAEFGRRGR
jgi:selenocysteine lyase/cysteine desulfurase